LGYLATILESGVPVVYGYISDAHDNHFTGTGTFGPGEAGYFAQLAAYNDAFGKFFARLAADKTTARNTLFVITADENDHFAGGPPSPANCDGVTIPCTYAKIGEIDVDLSRLMATQFGEGAPFAVHSDDAPTFYIDGNPGQLDPLTRRFENQVAALRAFNPITGNTDTVTQAIADQREQAFLHVVTADPKRTPNFIMFADPDTSCQLVSDRQYDALRTTRGLFARRARVRLEPRRFPAGDYQYMARHGGAGGGRGRCDRGLLLGPYRHTADDDQPGGAD
jgi:hypothetical protein